MVYTVNKEIYPIRSVLVVFKTDCLGTSGDGFGAAMGETLTPHASNFTGSALKLKRDQSQELGPTVWVISLLSLVEFMIIGSFFIEYNTKVSGWVKPLIVQKKQFILLKS